MRLPSPRGRPFKGRERIAPGPSLTRRHGDEGRRANVRPGSLASVSAPRVPGQDRCRGGTRRSGGMADATVLNTVGLCPCGFESHLRHMHDLQVFCCVAHLPFTPCVAQLPHDWRAPSVRFRHVQLCSSGSSFPQRFRYPLYTCWTQFRYLCYTSSGRCATGVPVPE
jgi:hypothetical protein